MKKVFLIALLAFSTVSYAQAYSGSVQCKNADGATMVITPYGRSSFNALMQINATLVGLLANQGATAVVEGSEYYQSIGTVTNSDPAHFSFVGGQNDVEVLGESGGVQLKMGDKAEFYFNPGECIEN